MTRPRQEILRRLGSVAPNPDRIFPSGLTYESNVNFDKFLEAFFADYKKGAITGAQVEAFKVFIMTWKWKGGAAKKMEVQLNEEDAKGEPKIVDVPAVPDFSYNPDGKKSVHDLLMPYGAWLGAMADYKVNLAGPSRKLTGQQEQMRWGGPVDASRDVALPQLPKPSLLDRLLR